MNRTALIGLGVAVLASAMAHEGWAKVPAKPATHAIKGGKAAPATKAEPAESAFASTIAISDFEWGTASDEDIITKANVLGRMDDLLSAAQHGDAKANTLAGMVFEHGMGSTPRDVDKAAEFYKQASDAGFPRGIENYGYMFIEGLGVPKDPATALDLFKKSHTASAAFQLGDLYRLGKIVAKDPQQAVLWYTRAMELGHPSAQHRLAFLFVEESSLNQQAKGVAMLEDLAGKGNVGATLDLANALATNRPGVKADPERAFQIVSKLADTGNREAQFETGYDYNYGRGVAKDDQKAAIYMRKAADAGFLNAQEYLAQMYWHGLGVPQSQEQATFWFNKVIQSGGSSTAAQRIAQMNQEFAQQAQQAAAQRQQQAALAQQQAAARLAQLDAEDRQDEEDRRARNAQTQQMLANGLGQLAGAAAARAGSRGRAPVQVPSVPSYTPPSATYTPTLPPATPAPAPQASYRHHPELVSTQCLSQRPGKDRSHIGFYNSCSFEVYVSECPMGPGGSHCHEGADDQGTYGWWISAGGTYEFPVDPGGQVRIAACRRPASRTVISAQGQSICY